MGLLIDSEPTVGDLVSARDGEVMWDGRGGEREGRKRKVLDVME